MQQQKVTPLLFFLVTTALAAVGWLGLSKLPSFWSFSPHLHLFTASKVSVHNRVCVADGGWGSRLLHPARQPLLCGHLCQRSAPHCCDRVSQQVHPPTPTNTHTHTHTHTHIHTVCLFDCLCLSVCLSVCLSFHGSEMGERGGGAADDVTALDDQQIAGWYLSVSSDLPNCLSVSSDLPNCLSVSSDLPNCLLKCQVGILV